MQANKLLWQEKVLKQSLEAIINHKVNRLMRATLALRIQTPVKTWLHLPWEAKKRRTMRRALKRKTLTRKTKLRNP